MRLIIGWDAAIARWVGDRLGIDDFGQYTALGIADAAGDLLAGVVFNNYRPDIPNIEATIATTTPRWCNRGVLRAIFSIPFQQYGCTRITAVVENKNQPARAFLCRLGFHEEGLMRQGFRGGGDAVIYGMLRSECRWLAKEPAEHVKSGH